MSARDRHPMPSIARDAARELVVIPWDVVRHGVRRLAAVPTRVRALAGRRDDDDLWGTAPGSGR